jgi:hypothetical protein
MRPGEMKHQALNTKCQTISKYKTSMTKTLGFRFGIWGFGFISDLELGIWNLIDREVSHEIYY